MAIGSVGRRNESWYYVVDLGKNPLTGRRRQERKRGFESREAELHVTDLFGDDVIWPTCPSCGQVERSHEAPRFRLTANTTPAIDISTLPSLDAEIACELDEFNPCPRAAVWRIVFHGARDRIRHWVEQQIANMQGSCGCCGTPVRCVGDVIREVHAL